MEYWVKGDEGKIIEVKSKEKVEGFKSKQDVNSMMIKNRSSIPSRKVGLPPFTQWFNLPRQQLLLTVRVQITNHLVTPWITDI